MKNLKDFKTVSIKTTEAVCGGDNGMGMKRSAFCYTTSGPNYSYVKCVGGKS